MINAQNSLNDRIFRGSVESRISTFAHDQYSKFPRTKLSQKTNYKNGAGGCYIKNMGQHTDIKNRKK